MKAISLADSVTHCVDDAVLERQNIRKAHDLDQKLERRSSDMLQYRVNSIKVVLFYATTFTACDYRR